MLVLNACCTYEFPPSSWCLQGILFSFHSHSMWIVSAPPCASLNQWRRVIMIYDVREFKKSHELLRCGRLYAFGLSNLHFCHFSHICTWIKFNINVLGFTSKSLDFAVGKKKNRCDGCWSKWFDLLWWNMCNQLSLSTLNFAVSSWYHDTWMHISFTCNKGLVQLIS